MPQQLDLKKSLVKRFRKRWFRRRMLMLSLLFPALGVGMWAAIQYRPWVSRGSSVPTALSQTNKDKTKPTVAPPRTRGGQGASLPPSVQKPRQAETPSPKIREGVVSPRSDRVPARPSDRLPDRSPKSSPAETGQESLPPAQARPPVPQSPGDSEFKLDALVWSDNPKSRFAVINGQLVRAGDTVKGVSIADIGRDHVALKSGNKTWELRLNFQPKSP